MSIQDGYARHMEQGCVVTMTSDWRPEASLVSNEAVIAYLDAAFEQGDAALIAVAIHDVVKAQGIDNVAAKAGMPQSELQKSAPYRQCAIVCPAGDHEGYWRQP